MASGDPYTTLTNTLRSIVYVHYYLRNLDVDYKVIAAGDDVVVLCHARDNATIR